METTNPVITGTPIEELRRPTADQAEIDRLSAAILRMPPEQADIEIEKVRLQRFALRVESWAQRVSTDEAVGIVGESAEGETHG